MNDREMADALERRVTALLLEIEKTEVRLQELKTNLPTWPACERPSPPSTPAASRRTT